MKTILTLMIVVACIAAAIMADARLTPPLAHIVLARDNSGTANGTCADLTEEGARSLSQEGIREDSTLTLIAFGTSRRVSDPVRLFDDPVPVAPQEVFGADDAEVARSREAMLDKVRASCVGAGESATSPIFRLVSLGLAHLQSRQCAPDGECYLIVQSDLAEENEPSFAAVIRRAEKTTSIELPAHLRASLDNRGIVVRFCSTSETKQLRRRATPETLARLWRDAFTTPDLVSFQPFCGQ